MQFALRGGLGKSTRSLIEKGGRYGPVSFNRTTEDRMKTPSSKLLSGLFRIRKERENSQQCLSVSKGSVEIERGAFTQTKEFKAVLKWDECPEYVRNGGGSSERDLLLAQ